MATQLTDSWAPAPRVVCDFGWYGAGGIPFATDRYSVNGVVYPPTDWTWTVNGVTYSSQYRNYTDVTVANGEISTTTYEDVQAPLSTPLKATVIFDAVDSLALGLPHVITPAGVSIVTYEWDLGNGDTGVGPTASTTYDYTTAPPDVFVVLTVIDSLDHRYTTKHALDLRSLRLVYPSINRQVEGSAR